MSTLQRFKFPMLLFGVSLMLNIIGAWSKIMHLPWSDFVLSSGMLMQAAAIAWAVFLAFDRKKN